MEHLSSLGLAIKVIPYEGHTIYRVIRAKQTKQINDYGALVTTVYDTVLYIRSVDVPVRHRGKGIARALLRYALEDQMRQHPELTVSELDDHSDRPWDAPGNLYYSFGYRFKPDDLEEKTMDLVEYKKRLTFTDSDQRIKGENNHNAQPSEDT
jgi:predicted GNAT family acetyltransferase